MAVRKKVATKAHVEVQRPDDGGEDEVAFVIRSSDGKALTGNQIIEAVAEAVVLYWENCPIEIRDDAEFDS